MKRKISFGITLLLMLSLLLLALTACEEKECEHSYQGAVTKAATCESDGVMTYTCSLCTDSYTEVIKALGHDEIKHDAKAPTCTEYGWDAYVTCSRCDYSTYAEKPALTHDEVSHDAKAPTCTEIGWDVYVTCSRCDYSTYAEKPALTHDEIPHEAKAPTCTEIGWDVYVTCSRCDYTTYDEMPALTHDEVTHKAKAPTCIEHGWDAYVTCSRCDYSTYVEKPALTHDEVSHDAKAPTCTEHGWDAYVTCSRCDYSTYVEKPALTHDEQSHEAKTPTCTEIGWDAYITCSRCDYSTFSKKDVLGHKLNNEPISHIEPTCTQPGYYFYSCVTCGCVVEDAIETLEALGHTPVSTVTILLKPTCTEIGSYETVINCSTCSNEVSRTVSYLNALGHDEINHSAKNPTCSESGWDAYVTCSRCDYTTRFDIAATGHSPRSVIERNIDPDCINNGSYDSVVYCLTCSSEISRKTEIVDALGHSEVADKAIAPTCTKTGLTEGSHCSVCNKVLIAQTIIDALGHSEVNDKAMAPTCTKTGLTEGSHCSVCGETLVAQTVVDALGHLEINNQAKKPTCTEFGWDAYITCSRCDYTSYSKKEALGHSYATNVTLPTCTEGGYTTYTCHCGDMYIGDEVHALGHNYVKKRCTVCNDIVYSQGLVFVSNGNSTCYISGTVGFKESELFIPAESPTGDIVVAISNSAFEGLTCITEVLIPDTVTSIGGKAFAGCTNIVRINSLTDGELILPNGITEIYGQAFQGLEHITKVVVPDTVTSIGEAAFNGCNSITDITLPFVGESPSASYTEYGVLGYIFGYLVEYSDTIENMVLQYSKHSQGRDYYFYYHIPNTLRNVNITTQTAIPNYAFRNCSFIETITISSAVTIGYHAFRNCSNLKSIAIPESVTAILDNAFSGCNKLGGVYITDVEAWCNLSFSTEESNPLVYAKLLYLNDELLSNLIIPDGIASIKYYAFYNCTSIKNVYIPATVTSIGYKAFCGCTNIIRINSLADGELILPNGITKIYTQAFQGLEHITKVVVPDTVTSIGEAAFNGCNSITDITLPFVGESPSASYTEYGVFGYIFGYSVSNSADGEDGVVQYEISNWKGSTYYYYNIPKNMRNVIITSQTAIPNYAFRNCSFIETITVKSNTSFGIDALNNCNATIKYI